MANLQDLQAQFHHFLLKGGTTNMLPHVAPSEPFTAPRRLAVYFDAYRIRLHEILKLDFPKVHILMGDEDFQNAFSHYIEQYPSHHFSVRYFGQCFANFLREHPSYKDFPILSEMAQFEWAVSGTLDAANAPIVTLSDLSKVPPQDWYSLTFALHPSVGTQTFAWNVPQLWQAIDAEEPPQPPVLLDTPIRWLFWRKGIRSLFQSCSPAENLLFASLQHGDDFGSMCETLIDSAPEEEIPMIAAKALHKWIHEEMVSELTLAM